jgi:polysaccharide pyruvyl transferase WcaK-like protein
MIQFFFRDIRLFFFNKKETVEKEFFIIGYFGFKNLGDHAMLFVALKELNSKFPDCTFKILSKEPLWIPSNTSNKIEWVKIRYDLITRCILKSTSVIFVGGTHLEDHGIDAIRIYKNIGRILLLSLFIRICRKPIYHLGIGVGPLRRQLVKILVRIIFILSEQISVRDFASFEILKELHLQDKVIQGFDISVLLDREILNYQREREILGISLLPYYKTFYGNEKLDYSFIDKIADQLFIWLMQNPERKIYLFIINGCRTDDPPLIYSLRKKIVKKDFSLKSRIDIIQYQENPQKMLNFFSECDYFISYRLHSAIFAYICSLPFIMINYHQKCKSFAEQIDLPEGAIITPDDVIKGKLSIIINSITENPSDYQASLPIEIAKKNAKNCFQMRFV